MKYTSEQLYELVTSSKSCSYFAQNYVIREQLASNQIHALEYNNSGKVHDMGDGRRTFRTTTMLARAMWAFCFQPERTTLFITHRLDAAHDMSRWFLEKFEELPEYLRPGLVRKTRDELAADNGSNIRFRPASANAGRGFSVSLMLLDNMSLVTPNTLNEMRASLYPCLSTGSICLEAQ